MANLAVYIELRDGDFTPASARAVHHARSIANDLGATVYAIVPCGPLDTPALEGLATELGRCGADRVIVCADPILSRVPLHATHGRLLRAVVDSLHPRLFLFPTGDVAAQLAAPLAAETGATYFPKAAISALSSPLQPPALQFTRLRAAWDGRRVIDVLTLSRPVVVVLAASVASATNKPRHGAAELELMSYPGGERPRTERPQVEQVEPIAAAPDPEAVPIAATTIVLLLSDVTPALAKDLADHVRSNRGLGAIAVITAEAGIKLSDTLCPANLIVVGSAASDWPPPIVVNPRARVGVCAPRKPDRMEGVAAFWKAGAETAIPDLGAVFTRTRPHKPT